MKFFSLALVAGLFCAAVSNLTIAFEIVVFLRIIYIKQNKPYENKRFSKWFSPISRVCTLRALQHIRFSFGSISRVDYPKTSTIIAYISLWQLACLQSKSAGKRDIFVVQFPEVYI